MCMYRTVCHSVTCLDDPFPKFENFNGVTILKIIRKLIQNDTLTFFQNFQFENFIAHQSCNQLSTFVIESP